MSICLSVTSVPRITPMMTDDASQESLSRCHLISWRMSHLQLIRGDTMLQQRRESRGLEEHLIKMAEDYASWS